MNFRTRVQVRPKNALMIRKGELLDHSQPDQRNSHDDQRVSGSQRRFRHTDDRPDQSRQDRSTGDGTNETPKTRWRRAGGSLEQVDGVELTHEWPLVR